MASLPSPVVVLDPGHGGSARVGGSSPNNAIGPTGLLEKDLTLDVAQRVSSSLAGRARVILTRTGDVNLGLADRAAVARSNHAELFVSIHFNGFRDPSTDGTEVWVAKSASPASVDFAQAVLRHLVAVTGAPDRGVRRADWGVLQPSRHAPSTAACLAEIAFLTNPDEAARLAGPAYRDQIAQALATAILDRIAVPAGAVAPSGQSLGAGGGDLDRRRLAAGIGGYGAPAMGSSTLDVTALGYGVPGGVVTDGFYRDRVERQSVTGRSFGREKHLGIDVSTSNAHGGGADDARRGLPVYAVVKRTISISDLNSVRATENDVSSTGLGIDGDGDATLSHAIVLAQPWGTQSDAAYGGVVGLACRYGYTRTDGSTSTLTLYIEFLHLITPDYLPKDGQGNKISADAWAVTSKGIGFGPRIQNGARLSADELCAGDPILVGHLGATQFPHVHIQAAYGAGELRYLRSPRFDPAVMIQQTASVTQSLSAVFAALAFNEKGFTYDVPGDVEPRVQQSPDTAWAAAATMLVNWRDHADHPVSKVVGVTSPGARRSEILSRLNLSEEGPADRGVDAYLDLLRRFGPLWVAPAAGGSGEVMTGAHGDGHPEGTEVWLIDPANGTRHHEVFTRFAQANPRSTVVHNRVRQA